MQTVDGGQGSSYEARMQRVAAVAGGIEERLAKRLELLDGYARVMNMIEIEVEMDMQVRTGSASSVERFGSACACTLLHVLLGLHLLVLWQQGVCT